MLPEKPCWRKMKWCSVLSSIEMGGATTGISIFHEGNLVFADSIPVGGMHVTNDIARGLSTTIAHAERMKTLWGSALPTSTDEREMLSVPLLGERGVETVQKVPRAMLTSIIRPRIDEIFELVAERLNQCPVAHLGGQRVVLSGGASQLTGVCEVAESLAGQTGPSGHAQACIGYARRWAQSWIFRGRGSSGLWAETGPALCPSCPGGKKPGPGPSRAMSGGLVAGLRTVFDQKYNLIGLARSFKAFPPI